MDPVTLKLFLFGCCYRNVGGFLDSARLSSKWCKTSGVVVRVAFPLVTRLCGRMIRLGEF